MRTTCLAEVRVAEEAERRLLRVVEDEGAGVAVVDGGPDEGEVAVEEVDLVGFAGDMEPAAAVDPRAPAPDVGELGVGVAVPAGDGP